MKKTISDLTAEQRAELDMDWSDAQRGLFYRSVKQQTKAVS